MNNFHTLEPTQELSGTAYNLWHPFQPPKHQISISSSNLQYRQQLQNNANNIMKYNTMAAINSSGNNPYTVKNTQPTNNTPHLYKSLHDSSNPAYGLQNSDLKQDYMTKERMNARMIAPTIPTNY
jgi:hypothetical protein